MPGFDGATGYVPQQLEGHYVTRPYGQYDEIDGYLVPWSKSEVQRTVSLA